MTLENKYRRPYPDLGNNTSLPFTRTQSQKPCSSSSTTTSSSITAVPSPSASFAASPTSKPNPPAAPGPLAQSIRNQASADTNRQAQQLVGEWSPEISRYGLTSATIIRDSSVAGLASSVSTRPPKPSCCGSAAAAAAAAAAAKPPLERPSLAHGKRPSEEDDDEGADSDGDGLGASCPGAPGPGSHHHLPLKKARLVPPNRINLGDLLPRTPQPGPEGVTSPIFFSNSSRPIASRFPSYQSSGIIAPPAMMDHLRDDHDKVTKQWLAKGSVSSSGSARSISTPSSWPFDVAGSPESRPLSANLQQLQDVGIIELLEQDERPTFIVDLANTANVQSPRLVLLFANASLRASRRLHKLLLKPDASDADYSRFRAWILSFVKNSEPSDVCLPSWSYAGTSWSCSTVRRRFRVVSGNAAAVSVTPTSPSPLAQASAVLEQRARGPAAAAAAPPPPRDPHTPRERASSDADYFGNVERERARRANSEPRELSDVPMVTPTLPPGPDAAVDGDDEAGTRPSFDWTRIDVTPDLPEHIRFARSVDWASTPLGPIESWSADLRIMSNLIMGSPHPAAMYFGPQHIAIYNESYIALAGRKHPRLMGMPYCDGWSEIWDSLEPVVHSAWHSGQATMKHEDMLFMSRNGFLEETYFHWSIVPMVGSDGSVVALYNPAFENTKRKITERRMLTLREIGEQLSQARDVRSFWGLVRKGLEYNALDVPFAMLYSVSEESESEVSSMHSGSLSNPPQILLEGVLGVPPGHPASVASIDLRTSEEGFAPYMRQSMSTGGTPVVLTRKDGTLPAHLADGLEPRGFGDPCETVVVFPVHPTTAGEAVVGFIVLGTNPRRPYNDDYRLFVDLLSRQLATSMASVVLFEDEIKRGQRAARLAAIDRQELHLQLRLRTAEAVESEYKFTRMAEFAPVGMFIADNEGSINYCNEKWWEISRHPRLTGVADSWMDSVREEDRAELAAVWRKLVHDRVAVTHEFRFDYSREVDGRSLDTWALLSASPELEGGVLRRIFGCLTDISQQKWAEDFQNKRREEAVELKRQQENFIDITSHEMRNPLSAILQCADEITNTITAYRLGGGGGDGGLEAVLESCSEASNTISLCANHQVRIANDILTLSKLDSQLLLVTPVDERPVTVVQNVLKMFESELNTNDIRCEFRVERSYQDLGVEWAKLDPSRLRQVLINLMTNAIKFTQSRGTRGITISLGASPDGSEDDSGIEYFPGDHADRANLTDEPEWGTGRKINLHISVADTGPGLNDQEKAMLFQRFSQATPRTHVQYGGSGLGLFISRILSELQGGRIGVVSEKGVGSTFAFYIKSRLVQHGQLSPSTTATVTMPPPAQSHPTDNTTTAAVAAAATGTPSSSPFIAYSTGESKASTPTSSADQPSRKSSSAQPLIASRDPNAPPPLDILIVEDNLVNQKVLQRQLRNCGNNALVANHGGEALEVLRKSPFWNPERLGAGSTRPNCAGGGNNNSSGTATPEAPVHISVVLMDLEMPVMDGTTCARRIRELERDGTILRHVPIIAVTAYARAEQVENAKAAGIDDVISKPFRIPELIPKIEELVKKYDTRTVTRATTAA